MRPCYFDYLCYFKNTTLKKHEMGYSDLVSWQQFGNIHPPIQEMCITIITKS